jgi:glycosyltransferase involved in cell wall biosynthesis
MKIIVNTSSYPRYKGDGIAPFVKSISEALVKLNHHIEVVAPYDIDVEPESDTKIKVHRFRYIWPKKLHILGHARSLRADVRLRFLVPLLLPFFLISSTINLIKHAKSMSAQVIHNHWVLPNGVSAAVASKILKIPFIISLHGSDIFMADRNFFYRAVAKWVFSQSAFVTACSQELYDRAKKINPNITIFVLAWGADPEAFKPFSERDQIRAKYGWDKEDVVIASLGRFVYKKGFDRLLSIIPDLSLGNVPLKVAIGGSGPLEGDYKKIITQRNLQEIASLPGQILWDKVPEFLAAADIFVLPSQRDKAGNLDGLPTVLLEAMACELPCVASDIGGVNLVIDHLNNGWLVEPDDTVGLVKAISTLVTDENLRKSLAKNARASIIEEFNWIRVAKVFENLFQRSLSKPKEKRLGRLYRMAYLQEMKLNLGGERILDIGCHDSEWLSNLNGQVRIGLDLKPVQPNNGIIKMVNADGCHLPFATNSFDIVYLLDVIEHIENDKQLVEESLRVLKSKGELILTTPNINITLFPPFLTGWISKKWGHTLRRGYDPNTLSAFFTQQEDVSLYLLNARWYRYLYLPLRIIFSISPSIALKIVNLLVHQENKSPYGENGFILLKVKKS